MSTKLLRKIKNTIPELRKSEKIVAEYILKDPKSIITLKTADASSLMGISEPTLIRFCKAMGFSGYQEFKINQQTSVAGQGVMCTIFTQSMTSQVDASRAPLAHWLGAVVASMYTAGSILLQAWVCI